MSVVLKLVGLAAGGASPLDGLYLQEYDPTKPGVGPNGERMIAHIKATDRFEEAKRFPTLPEALECWKLAYGRRPDGKPNRPLTAYSVEMVTLIDDLLHQHQCPRCKKVGDHRLKPGLGKCQEEFFTLCGECKREAK